MKTHMTIAATTCMVLSLWFLPAAQGLPPAHETAGVVNVRTFQADAVDVGKETEDWQPAFQKAIEEAYETRKPLYVPTG